MMIVTQMVYSYPREARYSCDPDSYEGHEIEEYDAELVNFAPQVGDVRSWEGHLWKVAHVEAYEGDSEHECYRVVMTMDGLAPDLQPWTGQSMYIIISAAEVSMGWPAIPDGIPQLGDRDRNDPDWEIVQVYDFEGSLKHHYSSIRVCWCAPIREPVSRAEHELVEVAG